MINESELKEVLDIMRDLVNAVDMLADADLEGHEAYRQREQARSAASGVRGRLNALAAKL